MCLVDLGDIAEPEKAAADRRDRGPDGAPVSGSCAAVIGAIEAACGQTGRGDPGAGRTVSKNVFLACRAYPSGAVRGRSPADFRDTPGSEQPEWRIGLPKLQPKVGSSLSPRRRNYRPPAQEIDTAVSPETVLDSNRIRRMFHYQLRSYDHRHSGPELGSATRRPSVNKS